MRNSGLRWISFILLLTACFNGVPAAHAGDLVMTHRFSAFGESQPTSWRVLLEFSQPVSVLDISRVITLTVNGKPGQFKIRNSTDLQSGLVNSPLPSERTIFIIEPKAASPTGATCTVFIGKDLPSADKKLKLLTDQKFTFTTCDMARLLTVEPFYNVPDEKGASLVFSADLSEKDVKAQIRSLPPVGRLKVKRLGAQSEGCWAYHLLGGFQSGKTYLVQTKDPAGYTPEAVLEPASFTFTAKGPSPTITVECDRSVLELKSRQLVPVSVISVSQVQCEIVRIPPLFAPEYSDLTVFASNDAPRPRSSAKMAASDQVESRIAEAIAGAETHVADNMKNLDAFKALASPSNGVELAWFLGAFASNREVFINQARPDKLNRLSLPIAFRPNPEKGGPILLKLMNGEGDEGNAARLFQVTDLSITYKFTEKELLLWVTSLESGKPVPNVAFMLFTKDDSRFVLGKTDENGLFLAKEGTDYPVIRMKDGAPYMDKSSFKMPESAVVLAATDGDSCFLQLATNRFRPWSILQAPPGKVTLKVRNAHVFTERGVYRPGETVFWKAAIRRYINGEIRPPAGESVTIRIISSRDDVVFAESLDLNEFGTCSGSFELKDYSPLGQYTVKVLMSKTQPVTASSSISWWETLIGKEPAEKDEKNSDEENDLQELTNTGFQVQFFEPPRHFVEIENEVKTRENTTVVGKKFTESYLECRIRGKYYTGGMVKHAKIRWTANLVPVSRDFPNQSAFLFGSDHTDRTLIETGESMLDKDGLLVVHLPMDKSLNGGMFGIEMSATVLDVDARPATKVETFTPKPKVNVGIQRIPGNIRQGDELTVETVVLQPDGKPLNVGNLRMDIFRKRYFYTQKRDEDGNIYYRWENGWVRALTSELPVKDGHASFPMAFADSGDYRLQANYVTADGEFSASQFLDIGYNNEYYSDDGGENNRQRSDSEIMLTASQALVGVNDTVKLDFGLPRAATHALVTCERDGIYEYRVIPLSGKRGSFEMKVGPECRPNAFFTVTIPCGRGDFPVYKSQVDQMVPRVYYGVTSIQVKNAPETLTVAILEKAGDTGKEPLKAHPAETRSITFKAIDGSGKGAACEMAVCVVDEAVLALTGYVTPILNRLADFSLPLTVFTGDLRLSVISQELYKLFATHALTGGDGGAGGLASDLALRKDFRPVAYWNPALMTDINGQAQITFKLPDTTTAYRIYVVALDKGSAFCSNERQMIVTKEFFLQPGLPRFLTAGDKAFAPLTACNKTDTAGQATLRIAESKNLTAKLADPNVALTALSNTVSKLELSADNGAGDGLLTFEGHYGAFGDAIQSTFPIIPRCLPINRNKIGHFVGKTELEVEIPADVAGVPESDRRGVLKATIGLSTTLWSKIAPGLKYLLQYPYGCVEQTSSGIIPLAGLRKLVADGLIPGITLEKVDKFLKPGISRLLKMQTGSGGFAYWMGERTASWWGTQYALFALCSAKDAGYDVPQDNIDRAVKYIRDGLFGKEPIDEAHHYGIYELSAVNLAINGGINGGNLEVLEKDLKKKGIEAQALLLWADALVKLTPAPKLKEMLKELNPRIVKGRGNWYDSSAREVAVALLATMIIDPDSKRADDLAGALLEELQPQGGWFSTADTGWCLLALGRYFERKPLPSEKGTTVRVIQAGLPPQEVSLGKNSQELLLDAETLLKDPKVTLEAQGGAMVNWAISYTFPDPASRTTDLTHGFTIEKTIKNLNGEKEIHVGDLVKVTVEFEDSRNSGYRHYFDYEYLALADPLPAGFIPVNTALKAEQRPTSSDDEGEDSGDDEDEWYSDWEDGAYLLRPDHFEMRDDQILAFRNHLWGGRFRFNYFARAICEGSFFMRPTRVFLMYDSDVYGMTTGQEVNILPSK